MLVSSGAVGCSGTSQARGLPNCACVSQACALEGCPFPVGVACLAWGVGCHPSVTMAQARRALAPLVTLFSRPGVPLACVRCAPSEGVARERKRPPLPVPCLPPAVGRLHRGLPLWRRLPGRGAAPFQWGGSRGEAGEEAVGKPADRGVPGRGAPLWGGAGWKPAGSRRQAGDDPGRRTSRPCSAPPPAPARAHPPRPSPHTHINRSAASGRRRPAR